MKEGLTYIAKRTKQLRYAAESYTKEDGLDGIIPNNPEEQWLQPISVYYAFDTPILRGDPVSIRAAIPNEGLAEDPYPYVEKTDSSKHTKCIGIALEYADPGEAVHVQPFGKVVFDDTKNPSGNREHHFSNDINGTYANLAGKVIYIGQEPGQFTIDFDKAYENGRNIIQVGVITDAPAKASDKKEFAIELQPEADGRGPLDSTQFEIKVGETITFEPNELKVIAIAGKQNMQPFQAKIAGNPVEGFVLFEPVDGSEAVLYGTIAGASEADNARLVNGYSSRSFSNAGPTTFDGGTKDYTVYISSEARKYVSVTIINRPQLAKSGYAIVAHAGYDTRSQVVGVYKNGDQQKTFRKDEDIIKVIKHGTVSVENLEAGKKYYLVDHGKIDVTPNTVFDNLAVIGTALSDGTLLVDCHNCLKAHGGVLSVGYIKPISSSGVEYGYLEMEGTYNKADYLALFNFLVRCELQNAASSTFTLNNPGYQIKYIDEGYEDISIPRVPFMKLKGTFKSGTKGGDTVVLNPDLNECPYSVVNSGYDISSLVYWSPMGIDGAITDPQIDAFDIHLSVKITEDDSSRTVEILPGFHQFNSNVYGFNWKLGFENGKYILSVDTGNEGNFGIAYIADPRRAPTKLDGFEYEIYISRRDNGYTAIDLEKVFLNSVKQTYDPASPFPISGRGVAEAVNNISSRLSAKTVIGTTREVDPDAYGSLADHFNFTDEAYKDLLSKDPIIASRALYEINSIIYKYSEDLAEAKPFIGILIDQLEKIKSGTFDANHSILLNTTDKREEVHAKLEELTNYDLTDEQKADIIKIINLLTNNKESGQVASSSIGLLIKAAGETQQRLMNIESALFGRDYSTLPDSYKEAGLDAYEKVGVSNLPARIGIVRAVNSLSYAVTGTENPEDERANPKNTSAGARIRDIYKQLEGTNGEYGETGIELNLLNHSDGSNWINENQDSVSDAVDETHDEKVTNTYSTYPAVKYDLNNNGTVLSPDNGNFFNNTTRSSPSLPANLDPDQYPKLQGINDALNRIMYKLNILTSEVHGYDDILAKPVRLNNIRERLNKLISDNYVKASETDVIWGSSGIVKSGLNTELELDQENYSPSFNPSLDDSGIVSIKDLLFEELFSSWDKDRPFLSTESEGYNRAGKLYRISILDVIKNTIGLPRALSAEHISAVSSMNPPTSEEFLNRRNTMSHSERILNIENALDTIIAALFYKNDNQDDIDSDYSNLDSIIEQTGDEVVDITRIQRDWAENDGLRTLNKLIFDNPSGDPSLFTETGEPRNILQEFVRHLTGDNSANAAGFTKAGTRQKTFIDAFKEFLISNHYTSETVSKAEPFISKIIPFDEVFDLTATGLTYEGVSVLDKPDLQERNIFYAKASGDTDTIKVSADNFTKAYSFKVGIVYQFYKTGTGDNIKFGLVNDFTEVTLSTDETIKVHGRDPEAYVIIKSDGEGNLDIKANKVSSIVIPTSETGEPGSLYIKS